MMSRGRRARDKGNTLRVELASAQNELASEQAKRIGMRWQSRRTCMLAILFLIVLFFGLILPTNMFNNSAVAAYTPSVFIDQIRRNLTLLVAAFTGNPVVYETRLMGVVIGAISGAALGLCGSTYQGAFNNPLAAPKTLGVMAGGALGALIWVLFLDENLSPQIPWSGSITLEQINEVDTWLWEHNKLAWSISNYGECFCSVIGCFAVVSLVVGITHFAGRGHLSNLLVIVCGQIIAAAVTGVITFARYVFTINGGADMAYNLAQIENYVILDSFSYLDIFIVALPLILCIVVVLLLRNRLTLLSFGPEEAQTMGVNVTKTRYIMIALCTFMTAWAISFAGHVAFLGFISAHLSRKIVGPDFRWLLPASVFTGACLITVISWLAQSGLPFTSSYATGTLCSIVGALLFLILAIREGRSLARGIKTK